MTSESSFKSNIENRIEKNVSLKDYSTIKIGGPAAFFFSAETGPDIKEAYAWAKSKNLPVFILGDGSNTLFSDVGFDGLVLHNQLKGVEWSENSEKVTAKVASGENWDLFVQACADKGLSGVEAMSGIPGQVGSTPIQNVGAYGQEVSMRIESVETMELESGQSKTFFQEECEFAYRTSRFKTADKAKYFVSAVNFEFVKNEEPKILYQELFHYVKQNMRYKTLTSIPNKLNAIRQAVLKIRSKKSMVVSPKDKNSHSLGSFFINPIVGAATLKGLKSKMSKEQKKSFRTHKVSGLYKLSAAWLIEQSGFSKGYTHKSARLSKNHCLAICNYGSASSTDVKALAETIHETVKERWGVELHPEPGFVGP